MNAAASTMLRREDERDGQNRDLRMLLSRIQRREDVLPEPARLTDQGGKARDYEFGVWQLREPDGTRWGVLCTIDDVTYKKHMEKEQPPRMRSWPTPASWPPTWPTRSETRWRASGRASRW